MKPSTNVVDKIHKLLLAALCGLLVIAVAGVAASTAQQSSEAPPAVAGGNAEFMREADEILIQMSKLLSLPVLQPLKKSVRTRQEIHDYLIRNMKEDKDDQKRDADLKALVALGLIPKGYPLQQKMLSLLTEQIAGLYDPKSREFFIASWTDPEDQRIIMAHELTHALQDQHFHIDKWQDAVKSNDDASLGREAVLEGSATVAMLDYALLDTGKSVRDLNGFDFGQLLGDVNDNPELSNAPMALRDEMLFPYTAGSSFVLRLLQEWNGWNGLHTVFERPPKSTQQILHPDLYLRNVSPVNVTLPNLPKLLSSDWKQLDENLMGEFGIHEVFKQFLGEDRAAQLAPSWTGDRYAILENKQTGQTLLVIRVALKTDADAVRYFGGYSEVLELKDKERENPVQQSNFFSFNLGGTAGGATPERGVPAGGVFLRCFASQCLSAEGTTREAFDAMTKSMGWPAVSNDPKAGSKPDVIAHVRPLRVPANSAVPARIHAALHAP